MIYNVSAGQIKIKLNNEVGIVFANKSMIFIITKGDFTVLLLDETGYDKKIISKFNHNNLNFITLNKNINIKNKIILNNKYENNGVLYENNNGIIYINYNNTNTCIYIGGGYNLDNCQFIYFYNPDIPDISLSELNETVFYNYKNPLSTNILEYLYEEIIATYALRYNNFTILKISKGDYEVIVIDNE